MQPGVEDNNHKKKVTCEPVTMWIPRQQTEVEDTNQSHITFRTISMALTSHDSKFKLHWAKKDKEILVETQNSILARESIAFKIR